MFNKEEAFNKISELVERFDDQKEFYKKSDYNETLTRKDYIDPFFEALGWDMNNKLGATHKPLLGGSEISRYNLNWCGGYIDYGKWLAEPRTVDWFEGERILVREVTSKGIIQGTIVRNDYVFSNSIDGIKLSTDEIKIQFILGIINSKLISFYHLNTSANAFKGTFPKVLLQDLRDLPIPQINKKIHDQIVHFVDTMLLLNKQLQEATLPHQQEQLKQRIALTDKKIDALVYELYGLSEEEIKIVEGVGISPKGLNINNPNEIRAKEK